MTADPLDAVWRLIDALNNPGPLNGQPAVQDLLWQRFLKAHPELLDSDDGR